jgi:CRP-like cAMP-binding protein
MNTNRTEIENTVDIETKRSLVKAQPLFKSLYDSEILDLAELFTEKTLHAGENVVAKGDPVDSIYLIVSGKADVLDSVVDENNQIKWNVVATLGPSDAIGLSDVGLYSLSGKRTATVTAVTDMVLLRLAITLFHGIALANSHIGDVMRKAKKKGPVSS